LDLDPAVVFWTIQTEAAWNLARRRGVLAGDARRVEASRRPAYRWLTGVISPRRRSRPPLAPTTINAEPADPAEFSF
jgi:hypothetical protein